MRSAAFIDLLFVTVADIAVNSGMEKPWDEYAKLAAELQEPIVLSHQTWEEWGMSDAAQRGMEALMALMPDAIHEPPVAR